MMSSEVLAGAVRGVTRNGVPFAALPPEGGREARGLVVAWHGADPPRTEEALAGALPLREIPAWRVYLGLPLFGQRMPEGGPEEVMQRGAEDAVTLLFHPVITQAVAELPEAVEDLRARLAISAEFPVALFGFSIGGTVALVAATRRVLPLRAVATFGAVLDMGAFVDYVASLYGGAYEWTDARRELAEEISVVRRGRALAESGAAVLLAAGSEDPFSAPERMEGMAAAMREADGTVDARMVAGVEHGFVEEPGIVAEPQGPQARAVEAVVEGWLRERLA